MLLYKESALSPIKLLRPSNLLKGGLGIMGLPVMWQWFGKMLFPQETFIDSAIAKIYGEIPFLGETMYGAEAAPRRKGLGTPRDESVRTQLVADSRGIFSPKGTMHGSNAVKHYLGSNIAFSESDYNTPVIKNLRRLQTGEDSRDAFARAVERGDTFQAHRDYGQQDRQYAMLSKKQKRQVREQHDKFLNALAGGGTSGWA